MSHTINFPDQVPELSGATVYLRELTEDDVPAWFERASDPESSALSGDPIPESVDEIRADLLQSNLASKRVLEKLGFHFERDIPDYRRSNTGSQDGYLYVLESHDNTAA